MHNPVLVQYKSPKRKPGARSYNALEKRKSGTLEGVQVEAQLTTVPTRSTKSTISPEAKYTYIEPGLVYLEGWWVDHGKRRSSQEAQHYGSAESLERKALKGGVHVGGGEMGE